MRNLSFLALALVIALSCVLIGSTPTLADVTLAQNGKTPYVIILGEDAIPAEKTAAQQLQKYLQEVTGAAFPIKSEAEVSATAPQILVGAGARAKVLLPHQDWSKLGSDGIVIKTVGPNLILAGGRPRGTLYAAFQFLEDSAGCRWWTPTENSIPRKSTLVSAPQNVEYVPPFSYREHFTDATFKHPEFATILRENGYYERQTPEWGGYHNILGFVHTFTQLLPPKKYFKDHPEWYSDPANGNLPGTAATKMPGPQTVQLCLSNPEVLDELTNQALALIKEYPDADYISISQDDDANYCRDAASMKLAEAEGSQSGPLLNFVNKVAERIHRVYPNIKVETLAYSYTRQPPKTIRPGKNVVIRLALDSADFGHPLDSDWNAETRDIFLAWAKIAPDLMVWNYLTNFSANILPHPTWDTLAKDLRFYAAHNVQGAFSQGDVFTGGVGDFEQLRAWLMGKLMWNPNLDQRQLTDEFLRGYYGAAAPFLRQYLDLIEQSFLAKQIKLSTYNQDFSFLSLDVANQAIRLFNQAEDAVKEDKVLSYRVRRERLSLDIAVLYRWKILQQEAAREGKEFLGPKDPQLAMTEFIKSAKSFGIKQWVPDKDFALQIPELEKMFRPAAPLPEFARKYPAADVIDVQQDNYMLFRPGEDTDMVDDAAASDGQAASVRGDSKNWSIRAPFSHYLDASPQKWHVYAMMRADAKANETPTGAALTAGVYDESNRKAVGDGATIAAAPIIGTQYQEVDLGVHELNGGMYFWFMPSDNPSVSRIFIDRILLIREK